MLPLTSIGAGSGGTSVRGGDTANVNETKAPAAIVTPLDASSCIVCMPGMVCRIRGIGMTKIGTIIPPTCRSGVNHDPENLPQNSTLGVSAPLPLAKMNYGLSL